MAHSTAKINKLISAIADNDSLSVTTRFDSVLTHIESPYQSALNDNQETLSFASVTKSTYCLKPIDISIASHKIPARLPYGNEDPLTATTDSTPAIENQSDLTIIDPTVDVTSNFTDGFNLSLMQLNSADTVSKIDTQLTNDIIDDTIKPNDISDDSYTGSLVTPKISDTSNTVTSFNLASHIDKNAIFSEIRPPIITGEKFADSFAIPDVISMQTDFIDVSESVDNYPIDIMFDRASSSPYIEANNPDLLALFNPIQIDGIDESLTYSDAYYNEANIYTEVVQLIGS